MHFQFNGFPDESVNVSSFSRKKFCILQFNNTVLVDAVCPLLLIYRFVLGFYV